MSSEQDIEEVKDWERLPHNQEIDSARDIR